MSGDGSPAGLLPRPRCPDDARPYRGFDAGADGSLSSDRVQAEVSGEGPGAPDGMKIDAAEPIYRTGPGIHVFGRDAQPLGVIRISEGVANFCFGGEDMRTLFVTDSTSLYRVPVLAAGVSS